MSILFSEAQCAVLENFGVNPDQLDPEMQVRLQRTLRQLEEAARAAASGEDASITSGSLEVESSTSPDLESHRFRFGDDEAQLTLEATQDLQTGQATFVLLYEDADSNVLHVETSRQNPLKLENSPEHTAHPLTSGSSGVGPVAVVQPEGRGIVAEVIPAQSDEEALDNFADCVEPESEEGLGAFLEGAIAGDFAENRSWSAIGRQTVVGLIPGVGRVADARDIIAATAGVAQGKQGGWLQLGIAIVAIVPGLDFLKGGSRAGRKVLKEVAEESVDDVAKAGMKRAARVFGSEAAQRAARELRSLMVARAELMTRLTRLAEDSVLTRTKILKDNLESAIESLRTHLTAADFSGALRDKLGLPVRALGSGAAFDHLGEVTDALRSLNSALNSARDAILRQLRHEQPGSEACRRLSEDADALNEIIRRGTAFLEIR